VAGTRVNDARVWTCDQLVDEGEHLVLCRRTTEDSWIGDDSRQTGAADW
jgi:hypothetical protein